MYVADFFKKPDWGGGGGGGGGGGYITVQSMNVPCRVDAGTLCKLICVCGDKTYNEGSSLSGSYVLIWPCPQKINTV